MTGGRVKNASSYRTLFELSLKDIMKSFGEAYKGSVGRMTALALKDQVMKAPTYARRLS